MYSIQLIDNIKRRNQLILDTLDTIASKKFYNLFEEALRRGVLLLYYSGHRDLIEQQKKYNDYLEGTGGKAAPPGYSWHQYKRAVDAVPITDTGAADWDSPYYPYINVIAKKLGLSWGGVGDSPHFVDKRGQTIQEMLKQLPAIEAEKKRRFPIIIAIGLLALLGIGIGYKILKR